MSFLHQEVHHAGVGCFGVDEQMNVHHVVEKRIERHQKRVSFHQSVEEVTGFAAPLFTQDDGLSRGTHSTNLELMSLENHQEQSSVSKIEKRNWFFNYTFYHERLRQEVRRQLSEAAAGNNLSVTKVQEEHLQRNRKQ